MLPIIIIGNNFKKGNVMKFEKYLNESVPKGGRQHLSSDLKSFAKRIERDKKMRDVIHNDPNSAFNKSLKAKMENQPKWTTLEGENILQVPGSRYAALPTTGKKNAAKYIIFDVKTREEVTFLKKNEVNAWLTNKAISEKE
jgi:hypothetical protein